MTKSNNNWKHILPVAPPTPPKPAPTVLSPMQAEAYYQEANQLIVDEAIYKLIDGKIKEHYSNHHVKFTLTEKEIRAFFQKEPKKFPDERFLEELNKIMQPYRNVGWDVVVELKADTQYQGIFFEFKVRAAVPIIRG